MGFYNPLRLIGLAPKDVAPGAPLGPLSWDIFFDEGRRAFCLKRRR